MAEASKTTPKYFRWGGSPDWYEYRKFIGTVQSSIRGVPPMTLCCYFAAGTIEDNHKGSESTDLTTWNLWVEHAVEVTQEEYLEACKRKLVISITRLEHALDAARKRLANWERDHAIVTDVPVVTELDLRRRSDH